MPLSCRRSTATFRTGSLLGILLLGALAISREARAQGPEMAPVARAYLDRALAIMESRSINRATLDWAQIRADAYRDAAGAATTADTHPAIAAALHALRTNHSFLQPPASAMQSPLGQLQPPPPARPEGRRLAGNVGYIRIPAFSGPEPDALAAEILRLVREVDGPEVCGWVVDLRGNRGGNMWPMLHGISPVLGEGVPGYFRDPAGVRTPWRVGVPDDAAYRLSRPGPPVAVLHDGETASSGEAIAVAFRGRPRSRSFGQPTRGVSTANSNIPLSDGALMILTTAVFEDRDGVVYGGVIQPDEVVTAEAAANSALAWLHQHAGCGPVTR